MNSLDFVQANLFSVLTCTPSLFKPICDILSGGIKGADNDTNEIYHRG